MDTKPNSLRLLVGVASHVSTTADVATYQAYPQILRINQTYQSKVRNDSQQHGSITTCTE